MASFNDIAGFEKFSVTLVGGCNHSNIYANGAQQVTVYIKLRAYDSAGDSIQLNANEITRLNMEIKLIDYHSSSEIPLLSGSEDTGGRSWSCTQFLGRYDQLPVNMESYKNQESSLESTFELNEDQRSKQPVVIEGSLIVITRYVMCPPGTPRHDKAIAASLELNDGTIVTTAKGSAFNSFIRITPISPIDYRFSNNNLTVQAITSVDQTIDEWRRMRHEYHVFISSVKSGSKKMHMMNAKISQYTEHSPDFVDWPDFGYLGTEVNSHKYAFAASYLDKLGSGVCYFWNRFDSSTPSSSTEGIGGYDEENMNNHFRKNSFNFSAVGYRDTFGNHTRKAAMYKLNCTFRDCCGNYGEFIARPDTSSSENYAREIVFVDV